MDADANQSSGRRTLSASTASTRSTSGRRQHRATPYGRQGLATQSPRRPPRCRTCGHRMKGHGAGGCPKARNDTFQRQQYLRELEDKHRGLTCVVMLDEGSTAGQKLVMLLLGEDGKAVHSLANAFNKGKKGRWTSVARCAWRAIVVISNRPWVQKAAEKLLLSWLSGWGKVHCKAD
ncbi:hypothetical protein OH76DRAFT_1155361 [Lentinus brumalis]|uniref:Uncharacterized protein n=1 Tax=Lentinus brumalis TaxID=2498619 RepID=A0A371DMR6_9APHY|nr:hypothetical protein OH76DRAFT_1155361 [Polyporus brumalis]